MHDNTPPHPPEINDEDDLMELVELADDVNLEAIDQDSDFEEVALEDDEQAPVSDEEEFSDERLAQFQALVTEDQAVLTFKEHKAPVFGCDIHPSRDWAATGCKNDTAYVWDFRTGQILFDPIKHTDTVTNVKFNRDGKFLATGDMAGNIRVHKFVAGDDGDSDDRMKEAWSSSEVDDMTWLLWHPLTNVLFAACSTGAVFIWRIPSGEFKCLSGHNRSSESAQISQDGKLIFVAYADGAVKLWDIKNASTVMEILSDNSLSLSCPFSTAVSAQGNLYAAGDENGRVLFCNNVKAMGTIEAGTTVECLAFSPSETLKLIACGTLGGKLTVWDYSKFALRTTCDVPEEDEGILRIKWINDHTLLASTTAPGKIHCFDARSGARKYTLSGHSLEIYEFACDTSRRIILTASEDRTAKIFQLPELTE